MKHLEDERVRVDDPDILATQVVGIGLLGRLRRGTRQFFRNFLGRVHVETKRRLPSAFCHHAIYKEGSQRLIRDSNLFVDYCAVTSYEQASGMKGVFRQLFQESTWLPERVLPGMNMFKFRDIDRNPLLSNDLHQFQMIDFPAPPG